MSIFGISILDNFGFEFMKNFLNEIRFITINIIDYFSNTQFYHFLNNLFSEKEKEAPSSGETDKIQRTTIPDIKKDQSEINPNDRRSDKIVE
jgi:hypothetical protein